MLGGTKIQTMINTHNYQGPKNHFFLHRVIQSGTKFIQWNENLKPDSVTNMNDPPSDVDRSDCSLRLGWPQMERKI